MIHHHTATPRHGSEEDGYDVIESGDGQVDIWHHGIAIRQDVGTPEEGEEQADALADADDARTVAAMGPLPAREGEPIAARDVTEGDALDLYGDQYADPFRDPGRGLEFELAAVIDPPTAECARPYVTIYTDTINFTCPRDHILYRKRI